MNAAWSRKTPAQWLALLTGFVAAAVAVAASTPALAQSHREPVTDPATLVSMGYAPDAVGIHRLMVDGDFAPVAYPGDDSMAASLSMDPFPVGGSRDTTATGFAFFPLTHTNEYLKGPSFLVMNGGLVSITAAGIYETQWNIPNGSVITYLDTFGYHNEASRAMTVTLLERCLGYLDAGNPVETVLHSRDHLDADGHFFHIAAIPRHVADTRRCSYHTRVRFSEAGAPSPALDMQLTKVRLFWMPDRIFVDGFETEEKIPIAGR